MKRYSLLVALGASLLLIPAAEAKKTARVAVLTDGQSPVVLASLKAIKQEVLALTQGEFEVQFPAELQVVGDFSGQSIAAGGRRLLQEPTVSLLLVVGPLAAQWVARQPTLPRPVIATPVFDPVAQGISYVGGKSGKKNLTYLTTPLGFERVLTYFRKRVPFRKLAVVLDQAYVKAFPGIGQVIVQRFAKQGVQILFTPVDRAAGGVPNIPAECDAAYLVLSQRPGDQTVDRTIALLRQRKLPSFTHLGRSLVLSGVLMGLSPQDNLKRRARRVALNVQRVLLGQDPASFNVVISDGPPELVVNMATARQVGYRPSWDLLSEAEVVGPKRPAPPQQLTLAAVIKQALQANLSLLAGRKDVEAGVYELRKAVARYLPSINGSFQAAFIDADRANPLFGTAERSLTARVGATQLLFNEPALANISIQKKLQRRREHALAQLRMDIMAAAATAYLNVQRAKALERLRKADLKVTKKNLELARVRLTAGATGKADIYRWQNKLANDKLAVIKAVAARNQAEIALNALRRRPLEQPFSLAASGNPMSCNCAGGGALRRYVDNPWSFAEMREFMVLQGLKHSPELKQLQRSLEAQRRALLSAKLAYAVPTLGFSFGLDQRLTYSGEAPDLSGLQKMGLPISASDDTSWTVGLALSWNLLEGGARFHRQQQLQKQLEQLQLQHEALAQQLEQRIRSAMHQAGSSFPGIALSLSAADAARKALALVTDAYARGATSIATLIDAQNATLRSELAAAVARYDFQADLVAAQRAVANVDFFILDNKQRAAWFSKLDAFVTQRRAPKTDK